MGIYTYGIFIICAISTILITLGWAYRYSMLMFFLSFTYIELMDKTTYLNHYYFISILSFLLIFLPCHAYFSIDAYRNPSLRSQYVPRWTVDAIKLLLGIVYFYAGLAKLNSDWLFHAMPLKIWLPSNYDIPLLGNLFQQSWIHYAFSWSGAMYDLCIPFLLLIPTTRTIAFVLVVFFHVLTRVLFPIGMFPYIMIVSAMIFFEPQFHHKLLAGISRIIGIKKEIFDNQHFYQPLYAFQQKGTYIVLSIFFLIQFTFPFRYLWYPGELFWTEEGYRFSWRVMLMEKAGYAQFKIVNGETGSSFYVDNARFLTAFQEKQMATQPDFILEYAHFLKSHYESQGIFSPKVYVESYVALNGRRSRPYIDPTVDLTELTESFEHKTWILPFEDEIKGL